MDKKLLIKLKKIISPAMTFLILMMVLFIFTSCKSDYREAIEGEQEPSVNEATDINTDTTDQAAVTEKETTDQSSENGTGNAAETETTAKPASQEEQQIIEVTASSGGYSPGKIEAKAGIPTILVMKSEEAYGCERAFNIPDLNISKILPENGQTEFDLGVQVKGTKLLGVCSMGMYYFQIFFD